jgi:hypothetical protein
LALDDFHADHLRRDQMQLLGRRVFGIGGDRLHRPSPGSVKQHLGSLHTLAWVAESSDEGGDGIGRVLARQLLHIECGSWAPAWIAALAFDETSAMWRASWHNALFYR